MDRPPRKSVPHKYHLTVGNANAERNVSMEDRSIEVSAPDVEEAIKRGLARLGLTREQVQIEVLQQERGGILGIGAREAIVRLSPGVQEAVPEIKAPSPVRPPVAPPGPVLAVQPKLEKSTKPLPQAAAAQQTVDEYALTQDQISEIARQTLAELLDKMGIECQVVIRHEEPIDDEPSLIALDVLGDDLKSLIGRQGEVLNALQYITRQIVSREVEQWVNLVVDVQQYKQRRARSLQHLAQRIAERVARTKQPVALEPMPPNERRVIHLALHDHPSVTTQSVGKGESRKVTIIPRR
jgi:spoIIIJ-associated protein